MAGLRCSRATLRTRCDCFRAQQRIGRELDRVAIEIDGLMLVGEASLALGKPRAALTATRRATELHKAHDLAALDGMSPATSWWRHSQALRANKKAGRRARGARDGVRVPAAGDRRLE